MAARSAVAASSEELLFNEELPFHTASEKS